MATIIKKIQKMVFVWFADPMQIIVVKLQRFCGNITIISPMSTIADEPYSRYKKKIRFVMIDSSNMKSEYATDEFIRRMYIQ